MLYIFRVKYTEHIDHRIIYFWFMLHISFLVCLYNTRHLSFKKQLNTSLNFQINTSIPKSSLTSIIEKPSHQHSSPQLMFVGKASRICWGLFVVEPNKHKASAETRIFQTFQSNVETLEMLVMQTMSLNVSKMYVSQQNLEKNSVFLLIPFLSTISWRCLRHPQIHLHYL